MGDDVLVKVERVSKRFCRSLKRSLWYGLQDIGSELVGRRHGGGLVLPQSSLDVPLRKDEFWAVNDVSFKLHRGECLGLIGRNGAGKTTLLRMMNGLIKPDTGEIHLPVRVGALIALGAGFNPVLSGRENVYVTTSIMGFTTTETNALISDIIDFAEIADFIDSPVQTYSSGMAVRLGFSIAAHVKADLLLLDEVLAVGDTKFRMKCHKMLTSLISEGVAAIVVSHNPIDLYRLCSHGAVFISGGLKHFGPIEQALSYYDHVVSSLSISERNNQAADLKLSFSDGTQRLSTTTGTPLSLSLQITAERHIPKLRINLHLMGPTGMLTSTSSFIQHGYMSTNSAIAFFRIVIERLDLIQAGYTIWVDAYEEALNSFLGESNRVLIDVRTPSYDPFGLGQCHVYSPAVNWIQEVTV